jgi:hypothetical protein
MAPEGTFSQAVTFQSWRDLPKIHVGDCGWAPTAIRIGDEYSIIGSQLGRATSTDLLTWKDAGRLKIKGNGRDSSVFFWNDTYWTRVSDLKPGQVRQIFIPVEDRTDQFTVTLKNITRSLPPAQQNPLFGDDLFVTVADAPTSFLRDRFFDFVAADTTFPLPNPQSGLVRLAIQGDWTNAGLVSADVVIERKRSPQGPPTAQGRIAEGEIKVVEFEVPAGKANLTVETFWDKDWASYPTDDLDLYLFDPNGDLVLDAAGAPPGATLDSPERTEVATPSAGTWTALLAGFTVHDDGHGGRGHQCARPNFLLRAKADGVRLKAN